MPRRGFAIIIMLIVLAVLVVGIGAYVWSSKKAANPPRRLSTTAASSIGSSSVLSATQAPNATPQASLSTVASGTVDTSNWLAYHNLAYGYSFKYPPEWSLTTQNPDWAEYLTEASYSLSSGPSLDDGVQVIAGDGASYFSSEAGFLQSAEQVLWGTCLGGGEQPDSPYSYTEVFSESTSTNSDGVFYVKLYVKVFADGVYSGTSGPLYAFDISSLERPAHVLTVIPGGSPRNACLVASSSRPESPSIYTFVQNVSI